MVRFIDRLRGRSSRRSAQDAKERLQFILFHDRIDLPPDQLDAMKREILEVISKYVSVEQDRVDIALQQRQRDSLIVAEIPFSKAAEYDDTDVSEDSDLETKERKPTEEIESPD
jgi:cell division topological specificity factor